jgi:plasmid stabilization system protein ParE
MLFDEELRRALDQIRSEPNLGVPYTARSGREYRRLLMPTTRHHVYYRIIEEDCVRVAAIWSATRGRNPTL